MWVVSIIDINTISIISMNWSKLINCVHTVISAKTVNTGKIAYTVKIVRTVLTVITIKTVKSVETVLTEERFVKKVLTLVFSFHAISTSNKFYIILSSSFGVMGSAHNWPNSYLSGRSNFVRVDRHFFIICYYIHLWCSPRLCSWTCTLFNLHFSYFPHSCQCFSMYCASTTICRWYSTHTIHLSV